MIHKTAIIDSKAKVPSSANIGPYSVIGPNVEIEEGVMECTKCGSKKTYSYTKQTRGGDEATTVFAICSE